MDERTIARLALSLLPRVGPKTLFRSYSVENAESLNAVDLASATLSRQISEDEWKPAFEAAWRIVNDSIEAGIRILSFDDPDYPMPLRSIPDPPPFLYVRGTLPNWDDAVAIIGTREPDDIALELTSQTVEALATERDVVIVSGLALGIDTRAHERAVAKGLRTVAVLANGLDTVYPKANAALAGEIIENGGALISEIPIGQRVTSFNLVARDRLQSGLSLATILIQSSVDGGSMHTARFTLEQSRTLVAFRPLTQSQAWSGNAFLTSPRGRISWPSVPQKLQKFRSLKPDNESFALRLSPDKIDAFIQAGLEKRFVPTMRATVEDDSSTLSLGLGL